MHIDYCVLFLLLRLLSTNVTFNAVFVASVRQ